MSTSELLRRLEESSVGWKAKTADEWELFTVEPKLKKQATKAAAALNKAMQSIARDISKLAKKRPYDEEWWGKKLAELQATHILPVERKYRNTGITDTEPRYYVAQGMINMVKELYGITGWTDLGDYI